MPASQFRVYNQISQSKGGHSMELIKLEDIEIVCGMSTCGDYNGR